MIIPFSILGRTRKRPQQLRTKEPLFRFEELDSRCLMTASPLGPETVINSFTTGIQQSAQVASASDGSYVVVWQGSGAEDADGIFAQRFGSDGSALGTQFLVNQYTAGSQQNASVAMDADGDFVVVWDGQGGNDDHGIYARRFDAAGNALSDDFSINTEVAENYSNANVGMNSAGEFVVSWQTADSTKVYVRAFDLNGVGVAYQLDVTGGMGNFGGAYDPNSSHATKNAHVAVFEPNNSASLFNFVVVWQDDRFGDADGGIVGRHFEASFDSLDNNTLKMTPRGAGFVVNTTTTGVQELPDVAISRSGNVVFTWSGAGMGDAEGVFVRLNNNSEVLVNATIAGTQTRSTLTTAADGRFVVAWESVGQDGSGSGVYLQQFLSSGSADGSETLVNTTTTNDQSSPAIASDANGNFVVAWAGDNGAAGTDIFTQRFSSGTNTARPIVTGVSVAGRQISNLVTPPFVTQEIDHVVVSFSQPMATSGAGSVLDVNNWSISNGASPAPSITAVTYGYNATTLRYEATVYFDKDGPVGSLLPLTGGTYILTAKSTLTDADGLSLDSQVNNAGGFDYRIIFEVRPIGRIDSTKLVSSSGNEPASEADVAINPTAATNGIVWINSAGQLVGDFHYYLNNTDLLANASNQIIDASTQNSHPVIAAEKNGFYVAWQSVTAGDADGGIYFKWMTQGEGNPAVLVNSDVTAGVQGNPDIVALNSGYAVAYDSVAAAGTDVYIRAYSSGNPVGPSFKVSDSADGSINAHPRLAADQYGNFVVVWEKTDPSTGVINLYARKFDHTGSPLTDEFAVTANASADAVDPAVAMSAEGDFVVAWTTGGDIFAQRFDRFGASLGSVFRVNTTVAGAQTQPAAVMDANGLFTIAWRSEGQDGDLGGIVAQKFLADGQRQGSEFLVATNVAGDQSAPAIAINPSGLMKFVYVGQGVDGSNGVVPNGVFQQLFGSATVARGLSDVHVAEDSAPSIVDLNGAFASSGPLDFFVSVSSSNASLIASADIDADNLLSLTYGANQSGEAIVTVRGTNPTNGSQYFTSFRVEVLAVNDPPIHVGAGIGPVNESTPLPINLANYFSDVEDGAGGLVYSIVSISDGTLLASSGVTGTQLALNFAPNAFGTSNVTIRATDSSGAYVDDTFVITLHNGQPTADSYEGNDSLGTAANLGTLAVPGTSSVFANIHHASDVDYYRFTVTSAAKITLQVIADRIGGALDSVLRLFDSSGNELNRSDDVVGRDSFLSRTITSGTYYVAISSFANTIGNYALSITNSELAPQIVKMTPDATVGAIPTTIRLFLDGANLNPASVATAAFSLVRQSADLSTTVVANAFSGAVYNAATKTITLTVQPGLADGRYFLTAAGSGANGLRDSSGVYLDGNRDGIAGGDFTGSFAIDTTAPSLVGGPLQLDGMAGKDGLGVLYSFAGAVNEPFPATDGQTLTVQLDVDGDGFDDGSATFARTGGNSSFVVTAATGIAANQGTVTVRARFIDAVGNVSAPVSIAINTNVPRVTSVAAVGSTIRVAYDGGFTDLETARVAATDSYAVTGRTILSVTFDQTANIATLHLNGGNLEDGTYTVTVYSGAFGVNRNGVELDGDGDGIAGGDAVQTVVVDTAAPIIASLLLASGQDSGTSSSDGLLNGLQPTFVVTTSDLFPNTSTGSITVQLDVDGDGFDDGEAQVFLRDGNSVQIAVQVNRLLAARTYANVRARSIDAAGNTSVIALLSTAYPSGLRIDRNGPSATVAATPIANGFRTTFTFDELVDPAAVAATSSYQLIDSSGNAVSLSGRLSFAVSTIAGSRTQVQVDVNLAGLPGDKYRFALVGSAVTDLAGNYVIGGNPGTTLDYSAVGPSVSSATFASALNGAAADQLIVQFDSNVSVDATTAGNASNYTLVGPSGPVAFSVAFNANSNRVTLRMVGGGDFAAGQYTLTVSANVRSVAGISLAGGAYTTDLTAPAASGAAGLNSLVFDGVVNALDTRTQSVASQTDEAQKAASQAELAERILDDIEVTVNNYLLANSGATSANIAAMINARIVQLFSDNLLATFQNLDFLPKEYVIVWSRDASFLLHDPSDDANIAGVDRVEIGYTLDGAAVTQVVGATLAGSPNSDSGLSLAIVPVNGLRKFLSNGVPVRVDGLASTPDRNYSLDLTGTRISNQAGVITFGANGPAVLPSYVDAAVNIVSVNNVDLSNVVVGLDTNLQSFNDQVLAGVLAAVGGDLSKLGSRSIVLWFDPVDFILTTPSGQRLGHDGTTNYHEIDGAYYSGNGRTELVVIPEALAGRYYLTLFGAGSEFRGVANFLSNGQLTPASLQGSLGATGVFGGINALGVILDFGTAASPQPTLTPDLAPFITGVGNSLQLADFQSFLRTASNLAGTFSATATVAQAGGGESVSALASLFNATANQAAQVKPAATLIDLLDQIFSEPINIGDLSTDALVKVMANQLGIDANSLPIETVSTISSALAQTLAPNWHAWSGLFNHLAKQSTQAAQVKSLPSSPSVNHPVGPSGDRQTSTETAAPAGVSSLFSDWQEDLVIALAVERSSDEADDRATPALLAGLAIGSTMLPKIRRRSPAPTVSAC